MTQKMNWAFLFIDIFHISDLVCATRKIRHTVTSIKKTTLWLVVVYNISFKA